MIRFKQVLPFMIALGAAWPLSGATALAQSAPAAPGRSASGCTPDLSLRDTIRVVIYAALPADSGEPRDVRILRGTVYQEFLDRFRNPPAVYYTDVVQREPLEPFALGRGFGDVRFTVSADGRISDLHLVPGTPHERFDSALVRAGLLLDSARIPFTTSDGRDTLQMRILLTPEEAVGAVSAPIIVGHLVTLRSTPPIPTKSETPWYPSRLAMMGQPGRVTVDFVVGVDGRVKLNTVRVIASNDELFTDAVRDILPKYLFTPATFGGCQMASWVRAPFIFAMP